MIDYLLFAAGLAGVMLGARWLVTGAGRLASTLRVPPIVIGLTIVGFGTSAPEIVVSIIASERGQPELVLGNVIGSNIANIGLVLGVTALLAPLRPDLASLRRDGPVMVGVTMLVAGLGFSGTYDPWMGLAMLAVLVPYLVTSWWLAEREPESVKEEYEEYEEQRHLIRVRGVAGHFVLIVGGIGGLIAGARVLVESAQDIASDIGVPEFVVAGSIIAVGTSIPELATGAVAARRGQADIAVGNVIGSNVFNLLGVLGIGVAIHEIPVAESHLLDLYVMLVFAVAGMYLARTGRHLARWEGGVLLAGYIAYTAVLYAR